MKKITTILTKKKAIKLAFQAINQYNKKGMVADAIFWEGIIAVFANPMRNIK